MKAGKAAGRVAAGSPTGQRTSQRRSRPHPVVIDTALLLQALLHNEHEAALLRQAWQDGRIRLLVCAETAQLLMMSLAAPALKLKPLQQQELLSDVLPYAQACKPLQRRASARLPLGPLLALSLAQSAGAAMLLSESTALRSHVVRQAARYPGLKVFTLREWAHGDSR